mgnify:CR=1 FL=1
MKTFLKFVAGLGLAIALLAAFIQFAPLAENDIPYPEVTISNDSAVLARGEYLVFGPAHCVECHRRPEDSVALSQGAKVALAGGALFDLPFAKVYVPNLTPDPETGIGNIENGAIARAMRFATNHNGNTMMPFMPFTHMCEYDVSAIISYLRAQQPVKNEIPKTEYTFLGKALNRFLLKPYKQTEPILAGVEEGATVEYGAYLANNVANCKGCHTVFDLEKMEYTGVPLAGGGEFVERKHAFKTPNLTPDPKTGHIYKWSEDVFVSRFRAGRVYEDSPMPWEAFKTMSDQDIRAIYKYLRSVPAYENKVEPVVANL